MPSLSAASALSVNEAGAKALTADAGLVRVTVGGVLGLTITATGVEAVTAPRLSVALAIRL